VSVEWSDDPAIEGELRIDERWTCRLLEDFIRIEVERTGKLEVVVGLSGGIDSAVSAFLAARALGGKHVLGLSLPYRTSDPDSLEHARLVARQCGIRHEVVDITPLVDAFVEGAVGLDPVRAGNVMARQRMIVLFDRSAAHDALVLGSTNKTELLLGYGTLHGDMASAINPIGDLYKTQVRALAAHMEVPAEVIAKPPSADLWPGQKDEDELGASYDLLDRVLALLVDARVSDDRAAASGIDLGLVRDVRRRIVRSQFKRKLPVIAKVSTRSVGWDFRYPRDWMS